MNRFRDNLWRDLVQEHGPALALADQPDPDPARAGVLRRPRVLAGSTLGLAGVAAALLLALGGSAAPPAFAVTRQHDGSVLVKVNVSETTQPWVQGADHKLAAMGIDEQIMVATQPGAATTDGAVSCTALGGANTPAGPRVNVLLGQGGTGVIPSGNTGAGIVHLSGCVYYKSVTRGGSGNTGAG
jgi:hypothetical protein